MSKEVGLLHRARQRSPPKEAAPSPPRRELELAVTKQQKHSCHLIQYAFFMHSNPYAGGEGNSGEANVSSAPRDVQGGGPEFINVVTWGYRGLALPKHHSS